MEKIRKRFGNRTGKEIEEDKMKGYTPVLGCESKNEAKYITERLHHKTRIDFGYFGYDTTDVWMIFVPSRISPYIDTSQLSKLKTKYRKLHKK